MVEKRVKKFGQGPPPFSGNARKKTFFFRRASLTSVALGSQMSEGGGLYNYKGQLAEKPKPDSVSQGVRGGGEGGTKYCPVLDPAAECVFCHC